MASLGIAALVFCCLSFVLVLLQKLCGSEKGAYFPNSKCVMPGKWTGEVGKFLFFLTVLLLCIDSTENSENFDDQYN